MRRVEAVISPLCLEEVKERLRLIGVPGMTVIDLKETGDDGSRQFYRGTALATGLVARVRVDVVVVDDMVESVINAIILIARKVGPGDGRIFVTPVDEAIRIRTGETGPDAL